MTNEATGNETGGEITFSETQQAHLNKLIGTARQEARDKARAEYEAEARRQAEEADKAKLAESQQFKELSDKLQTQLAESAPKLERLAAYEEMVKELLKDEIKALGEGARTAVDALPGSPDELAKLQWLRKNAGLFQGNTGGIGSPRPGINNQPTRKKGVQQERPSPASKF